MRYLILVLLLCISRLLCAQGFTEIASELGVDAGYYSGEYGGGVSFVDFNLDGLDDLTYATGTGQNLHFYQNNGNGFTELEPLVINTSEVKQVLWIDFDNDGDLDLYTTAHNGNKLYKQTGNLSFTDITSTCGFTDPGSGQSFCASWLDYDHDALPDLIVSFRIQHLIGKIILYHNLGNDQFEDVTNEAGLQDLGNSVLAMATLDYNNDGWEDIFVGQDYQAGCLLLKNNANGSFTNISVLSNTNIDNNTMTVTIGDYNGDGLMDIYLTDTGEGNSLLRNLGSDYFVDEAIGESVIMYQFTWGAVFTDADNDMDVDLHVNRTSGSTMFMNEPDGPFVMQNADQGFQTDYYYNVGMALGDYNNDGGADIAKNGSNGSPSSFWQNNNSGNNYITIDLHGIVSNTMAIGAVVDVYAGGQHQIRRVGCGEGFSSQNSYSQFFGLGSYTLIDDITVHWPNGITTSTVNVPVNQRIDLYELIPLAGCMDEASCNYNPEAVVDDGNCIYPELYYTCEGICISDSNNNGTCDELEIFGCTSESACNYNSAATTDDASCLFAPIYYDCNGMCLNDVNANGICDEMDIYGCSAMAACNYNASVTFDDGSCIYPESYYDCDGMCLEDADNDGICDALEIAGCTSLTACNYNPDATDDDGSCAYIQSFEITGEEGVEVGSSYIYTYTYTPGSTYQWNVATGAIISGQGTNTAEIVFDTEGEHEVSVIETNDANCIGPLAILTVNAVVGFVSTEAVFSFSIYPNPASDVITVQASKTIQLIQLFNAQGQVVLQEKINAQSVTLNLSGLSGGIYLLSVNGVTKALDVQHQ